ncbi:hypothetical protein NIE79_003809 [Micromonospora sp. NIE79]|uniref:YxiG-like domain-containing protein n=1 Tax=Micromonospora trifolii TaxID=2911208 RepID=A0ABS9N5Y1_9ACTN|nr:hypothetical protein [Micromonospora trifolii]
MTDREIGPDLDGFVWAVRWQPLYPGAKVVADSECARSWADKIGIPFHEVHLEMNAHAIALVFSDLEVTEAGEGYAPFTVTEDVDGQPGALALMETRFCLAASSHLLAFTSMRLSSTTLLTTGR